MLDFSASEIAQFYACRVPALKQTSAKEWRSPCPVHFGKDLNFTVDSATGMAHCHSRCGRGWDVLGLEMEIGGLDFPRAKESVYALIGRPRPDQYERNIESVYDYCDQTGKLRYQVVRMFPKQFRQRRPDGAGGWNWKLGDVEKLPFNLADFLNSRSVTIAEGEKDVLTLKRHGIPATCNSGGAAKWHPELNQWFQGKDVIILPDNDDPGREHALNVAAALHGKASRIRLVELPGLPAKGDVSDWFATGGTKEKLRDLVVNGSHVYEPGFKFVLPVPSEDDKWVLSPSATVEAAGGIHNIWQLAKRDGIPTPFEQLTDDLAGGLRNGEVYILGGARGSGKTSLALQFVREALYHNKGVLLFSLEMNPADVLRRIISIEESIDLSQIRILQKQKENGTIGFHDDGFLAERVRVLMARTKMVCKLPLLTHQKPSVTPGYLIEECTRLKSRQKIDLIVIDHMQLMGSDGNEKKEYEKFTAISRAMKSQVARELNVPVLVVSQVSRSNSFDKRTELEMTDLRGTGALEEDAAAVMLLYHDAEDVKKAKEEDRISKGPVKAILKLAKNRFGISPTELVLNHYKRCTRFISENHVDAKYAIPEMIDSFETETIQ